MEELRDFLKQVVSFDDKELDETLTCFKEIEIEKDQFYVKQDEICKKAAFIKKGLLKLFYNPDGIERVMLFFPIWIQPKKKRRFYLRCSS